MQHSLKDGLAYLLFPLLVLVIFAAVGMLILSLFGSFSGLKSFLQNERTSLPKVNSLAPMERSDFQDSLSLDPIANWKTYTNNDFFHFSFKFPPSWTVKRWGKFTNHYGQIFVVSNGAMLSGNENTRDGIGYDFSIFPKTGTFEESIIQNSFLCGVEGCKDPGGAGRNLPNNYPPFFINNHKAYKIPSMGVGNEIYLDGDSYIVAISPFDETSPKADSETANETLKQILTTFQFMNETTKN